ncbi:MAG: hypothetical protein HY554_18580 [Elusimicrobia bacterium]|nr:hypothetical protein [Elusimicrobiota bacterium]
MAREATPKKKTPEEMKDRSIEQLILDQADGKYGLVPLASTWALVLRRREEFRHLTQPEILDLALRQVLSGEIGEEQVKAHADEIAAQTAAETGLGDSLKDKKKF